MTLFKVILTGFVYFFVYLLKELRSHIIVTQKRHSISLVMKNRSEILF